MELLHESCVNIVQKFLLRKQKQHHTGLEWHEIEYIITEMEFLADQFFDVNDDVWTLTKQNVYLSALMASTSVFVLICVCAEVVTVLIWI